MTDKQAVDTTTQGWDLLMSQARIIAMLPLEDWINAMNRADSLGIMIDPTLWIKGHKKMDKIREVIEAALPLKRCVLKLQKELAGADELS